MNSKSMLRRAITPILLTLAAAAPITAAAGTPEQADLAERLMQTGMGLTDSVESMPVAAALADAAERMMTDDKRLIRTAADLRLRLGHRDKAIELLGKYRKLDPTDQLAQVQTIDLLVDRMESAEQKAAYYKQVMSAPSVPAEVRSHAAVQLAVIEAERGRDDDANVAVDEALKLNPVNPKALQFRLERVMTPGTSSKDRAATLVAVLQANPMASSAMGLLADELARVGATEQSLALYKQLVGSADTGSLPAPEDMVNYAALLLATGQLKPAVAPSQMALQVSPNWAQAQFMRALIAQQMNDKTAIQAAYNESRQAMIKTVMQLHTAVDPNAIKPTDDAKIVLPNVKADAEAIAKMDNPQLATTYQAALGDIVWLDAFFAATPPEAPLAEAITALGADKSNNVARAVAFASFVGGNFDDAKAKLAPLVEQGDLLSRAAMLVVRLKAGESKESLAPEAQKLITQLPTGVWGATLRWTLRDFGPFDLRTADTPAIIAESAKLSPDWLAFGKNGRSFYVIDVDVIKAQCDVGEPMVMSITLQNLGTRPLAIGPGGPVDQQVILDATVRGSVEQPFPGAAVSRMTGALVLQPRQKITSYARVDNPQMFAFLAANPQVSMAVFVSAIANPMLGANGIVPGPGGFRSQSRSVLDRRVAPFQRPDGRQQLIDQLNKPDAKLRLHALQAIAGNGAQLAQQSTDESKQLATQAAALVKKTSEQDASSTVRAIAMQLVVGMTEEANRDEPIKAMIASKDAEARLLGALLVMGRPQADRKTLLEPLTNDADDVIKRLGTAIIALPESEPATQPAS